jgi:hypothetical protein
MNLSNLLPIIEYNADIYFFFRGEYFPSDLLKKIRGVKVNLSSEPFPKILDNGRIEYSIDSLNRFFTFLNIRNKSYDYIFHYDKTSLSFLEKYGLFLSGDFVFPVSLNIYRPMKFSKKWISFL